MDAKEALKIDINLGAFLITASIEDMNDSDLLVRPVPGANHIAWQLGHLITSEFKFTEAISPGSSPALPAGFADKHTKATAGIDDPKAFCTKKEYLEAFQKQRAASLAVLDKISTADLTKPGPDWARAYAPTVAAVFAMHGSHYLMHVGQFSVVRRKLGKPILM